MTARVIDRARIDAGQRLLRDVATRYYLGCKAYHICAETQAPERVHWHIRLKTLAQFGNQLADALQVPRPNWPILYHTARRFRRLRRNPFTLPGTSPAVTP